MKKDSDNDEIPFPDDDEQDLSDDALLRDKHETVLSDNDIQLRVGSSTPRG